MKEEELREKAVCKLCGKPFGHTGLPMFWRVRMERYGLKKDAMDRQQGLTMMLGGHAQLAMAMGLNEDMTEKLLSVEITVCENCCTKQICIAQLAGEDKENKTEYISKINKLPGKD